MPGLITAGTYRKNGSKRFWLVGRAKKVTMIETRAHRFDVIVLELSAADAATLASAVQPLDGPGGERQSR